MSIHQISSHTPAEMQSSSLKRQVFRSANYRKTIPAMPKSRDRWWLREQGGVTLLCIPAKAFMFNIDVLTLFSGLE